MLAKLVTNIQKLVPKIHLLAYIPKIHLLAYILHPEYKRILYSLLTYVNGL